MPTVQVTSSASGLLQDVADILGKSRKTVIITGAGISTNSGIPDFRSQNGLYSLIQEQFESAQAASVRNGNENDAAEFDISDRPLKRRRLWQLDHHSSPVETPVTPTTPTKDGSSLVPSGPRELPEALPKKMPCTEKHNGEPATLTQEKGFDPSSSLSHPLTQAQLFTLRPSIPRHTTRQSSRSSYSQDSVFSHHEISSASSQTEDSAHQAIEMHDPGPGTTTPKKASYEAYYSSPLSSPPPVLFDPYRNMNSSTGSSSRGSPARSESSDIDSTQQSLDFLSSQASTSNLRNMKGRDLFDSNIWADPLKTSVFYRFATSLRQKVKEVEPTTTHRFIAQMRDNGKLMRTYTQNIDEIEKKIGLSTDLKHGAGQKKRKPIRQPATDPEKDVKENSQASNGDECAGGVNVPEASQASEDALQNRQRPGLVHDKGVECVFLHGSLHSLRCFVCGKLCDWDEEDRESRTLSGEQPECPHCAGATAARQERGKRALGVGKLRPDIVLYGEEHPQSDLISSIVQHDLSVGPDVLLVLGTSLRVHGLKIIVKEFSRAVHNKGGKVVAWGDVIDYWVEWDCDAWVADLRNRKPQLWMSPDEIQELDRQKKEAMAEKKREISKRREEMIEKKRDSIEEKKRQAVEAAKLRPPPKNPTAWRNDTQCGAYVVWEIFQTLAKISNRPFDNLGYTPPPSAPEPPSASTPAARPDSRRPPKSAPKASRPPAAQAVSTVQRQTNKPKVKKPRKSAPAALTSNVIFGQTTKPAAEAPLQSPHVGKGQYEKAARELARTGKVPTPARMAALNNTSPPQEVVVASMGDQLSSITAAVKVNPRRRKRKVIDGVEVGGTGRSTPSGPRRPLPPLKSSVPPNIGIVQAGRNPPDSIAALTRQGLILPPLQSNWMQSPTSRIEPLEPTPIVSPVSPLADMRRFSPTLPRHALFAVHQSRHPMIYSDPLVRMPYQVSHEGMPMHEKPATKEDKTPSPSSQLHREWEVANRAVSYMQQQRQ
ncbi:hypothetical protein GGR56DRAFT_663148 [Xylariaceae sp. FL0804]|nr:hypothetical protein GGR56DRAFT_663148 [Xylariaceae sp. FL0804]